MTSLEQIEERLAELEEHARQTHKYSLWHRTWRILRIKWYFMWHKHDEPTPTEAEEAKAEMVVEGIVSEDGTVQTAPPPTWSLGSLRDAPIAPIASTSAFYGVSQQPFGISVLAVLQKLMASKKSGAVLKLAVNAVMLLAVLAFNYLFIWPVFSSFISSTINNMQTTMVGTDPYTMPATMITTTVSSMVPIIMLVGAVAIIVSMLAAIIQRGA